MSLKSDIVIGELPDKKPHGDDGKDTAEEIFSPVLWREKSEEELLREKRRKRLREWQEDD